MLMATWAPFMGINGGIGKNMSPCSGSTQKSHVDQLHQLIHGLKQSPDSDVILYLWNVADLDRMALPPCHTFFQCYVSGGHLDLQLYQRSADVAVGFRLILPAMHYY